MLPCKDDKEAFEARAERAWQAYLLDGASTPAEVVVATLQARLDAKRAALAACQK